MKKKKTRRLWLNVRVGKGIGVTKKELVRTLIDSIDRGDYAIPERWNVVLEWRNKEHTEMNTGFWTEEMEESAKSSDGWDKAVREWLRRRLEAM